MRRYAYIPGEGFIDCGNGMYESLSAFRAVAVDQLRLGYDDDRCAAGKTGAGGKAVHYDLAGSGSQYGSLTDTHPIIDGRNSGKAEPPLSIN